MPMYMEGLVYSKFMLTNKNDDVFIQDRKKLSKTEIEAIKINSFVYDRQGKIYFFFSNRVTNIFKKENISTLADLLAKGQLEYKMIRGFGKKSWLEIQTTLQNAFNFKIW